MGYVYECRKVQSGCSWTSESVNSREEAKQLGVIHLSNKHGLSGRDWDRLVENAIR